MESNPSLKSNGFFCQAAALALTVYMFIITLKSPACVVYRDSDKFLMVLWNNPQVCSWKCQPLYSNSEPICKNLSGDGVPCWVL